MKKHKFPLVLTGSLTEDGSAAYMRADKTWARRLSEAKIIESAAMLTDWMDEAARQEQLICDPYPMSVRRSGDETLPCSTREQIRSQGPTTRVRRPDPGHTAERTH